MRRFSIRPTLTLRGRQFKGLRGWSGKPAHPPLTDFPVAAYVLAAVLDVISSLGRHETWARDFFRAGTYVFIGGAAVSVLAALTGFWDWFRSTERGTQARRTANTHAVTMITVTVLALIDIGLRLSVYHTRTHPTVAILVISIVVALLVSLGAAFGGTLIYDYGFNVETAGDSPVWHPSETDVLPGEHHVDLSTPTPPSTPSTPDPSLANAGTRRAERA
jgi:uncharacterized membrane protein